MGKYFGRQPRYSREEAEAQAKAAIDAAVAKGRPPDDEWKGLASRTADLDRELATRPRIDIPPPPTRRTESHERPRAVSDLLRPRPAAAPEPEPEVRPAPAPAAAPAGRARPAAAAPKEPAKRATRASAPAARTPTKRASAPAAKSPTKRSTRTTQAQAPAPAKRPAARKRQA